MVVIVVDVRGLAIAGAALAANGSEVSSSSSSSASPEVSSNVPRGRFCDLRQVGLCGTSWLLRKPCAVEAATSSDEDDSESDDAGELAAGLKTDARMDGRGALFWLPCCCASPELGLPVE